jgi:hypothetical protein
MTTTLIALTIMFQQGGAQTAAAPQEPSAGELVFKSMERYQKALTISGGIKMTQTAAGSTQITNIELDYIRPNRIYLHQIRTGTVAGEKLLIGNGTMFAYDKPEDVEGKPRFVEPTQTRNQDLLNIGDMYLAAQRSLLNQNPIQDFAIGRRDDLAQFRDDVVSLKIDHKEKVGADDVYVLTGEWRMTKGLPTSGHFEMYITADGDFRRFVLREQVAVPNHPEMAPVQVTTTYDSSLKVDGDVKEELFKTIR